MKFPLILFILIFSVNILKGQDTVKTTLIIFDQDNINEVTHKNDKDLKIYKNAFKFNPLLILNGEAPVYYERALNNNFSIEGAIGITFKNYIGNVSNFLFEENNDDEIYDTKKEKIKSNISFKLGVRYYTGGVVLDGFYFALEYANRKYSAEQTITYENYDPITFFSTTQTNVFNTETLYNEFKLIAGSQSHSYWDNFFIDYYFGVGINKQSIKKISRIEGINNSSNYTYELISEKKLSPSLYAGLKIGFEF